MARSHTAGNERHGNMATGWLRLLVFFFFLFRKKKGVTLGNRESYNGAVLTRCRVYSDGGFCGMKTQNATKQNPASGFVLVWHPMTVRYLKKKAACKLSNLNYKLTNDAHYSHFESAQCGITLIKQHNIHMHTRHMVSCNLSLKRQVSSA